MNEINSLNDFIGQENIIKNLNIYIQSAKENNTVLNHILFMGDSGLGKTTLSKLIANEFKQQLKIITCSTISEVAQLSSIFSSIRENDFILLDEIHGLNLKCEEFLYPILQDYRLDFIINYANHSKIINIDLPPFTLIGATTKPYSLSKPLLNRFPLQFTLKKYNSKEIILMVKYYADLYDIKLNNEAIKEIADISRYSPRILKSHLYKIKNYSHVYKKEIIDLPLVEMYKKLNDINSYGLYDKEIEYLKLLLNNNGVGINNLAINLNLDNNYITDMIETYLLSLEFIVLKRNGRHLTDKGNKFIKSMINNG